MKIIETERLVLRTWQKNDVKPFFDINQDMNVIEFLLSSMTIEEVENFIQRCNKSYEENKFCLFATEIKETKEIAGFIGLSIPRFQSHFTPAVEIGWRLGSQYWNKGYATEGANACLTYGFNKCSLNKIVSFTVPNNKRSIAVMKKIGMKKVMDGDFIHPLVPINHKLSKHVLYYIDK
jgi:RimJ/RimL family protein N-acetyltransferase